MTLQLGWDHCVLAALIVLAVFWLGAIAEYLWHAIRVKNVDHKEPL